MSEQLTGQVALVTGGGRGLGRGFAQAMASAGAAVAITARTESQINETVKAIKDEGGQAVGFSVDVTDQGGMEETTQVLFTPQAEIGKSNLMTGGAPWK